MDIEKVTKILYDTIKGEKCGEREEAARQICQLEPKLTPTLSFELENTKAEYQDKLAELLNFASGMGDYGDPHGLLAVISPISGKILKVEGDKPMLEPKPEMDVKYMPRRYGKHKREEPILDSSESKPDPSLTKSLKDIEKLEYLQLPNSLVWQELDKAVVKSLSPIYVGEQAQRTENKGGQGGS